MGNMSYCKRSIAEVIFERGVSAYAHEVYIWVESINIGQMKQIKQLYLKSCSYCKASYKALALQSYNIIWNVSTFS